MALTSGTRLGPYEILSPLGAGGMGEVYRARDSKLDRDVAIKVLPQSVAADPETLAPGNADLLRGTAQAEQALGRWESAVEHFRQAERLDPRSVGGWTSAVA